MMFGIFNLVKIRGKRDPGTAEDRIYVYRVRIHFRLNCSSWGQL